MEKAHRRVAEGYLVGHYSSYKQPLREARRAFCCGNWLNGPPKQTSSARRYILRSLPISVCVPRTGMHRIVGYYGANRGNANCARHEYLRCYTGRDAMTSESWTRVVNDDEGDDRISRSLFRFSTPVSSRLRSQLSAARAKSRGR